MYTLYKKLDSVNDFETNGEDYTCTDQDHNLYINDKKVALPQDVKKYGLIENAFFFSGKLLLLNQTTWDEEIQDSVEDDELLENSPIVNSKGKILEEYKNSYFLYYNEDYVFMKYKKNEHYYVSVLDKDFNPIISDIYSGYESSRIILFNEEIFLFEDKIYEKLVCFDVKKAKLKWTVPICYYQCYYAFISYKDLGIIENEILFIYSTFVVSVNKIKKQEYLKNTPLLINYLMVI